MGRPQDKYETSTYSVEFNIKAGVAYIQKKTWGTNMCGKDPRAVDCGAATAESLADAGAPDIATLSQLARRSSGPRIGP